MPSKNSLAALKANDQPQILPEAAPAEPPAKGTGGRPRKAKAEKRSYRIALALTEGEGAKVAEKAGLVPEATYIYDVLKKAGVFQ